MDKPFPLQKIQLKLGTTFFFKVLHDEYVLSILHDEYVISILHEEYVLSILHEEYVLSILTFLLIRFKYFII